MKSVGLRSPCSRVALLHHECPNKKRNWDPETRTEREGHMNVKGQIRVTAGAKEPEIASRPPEAGREA